MEHPEIEVRTMLRIPGTWSHPGELIERLPTGFGLTPEMLVMPDGQEIEFAAMPPDDQFAEVFRCACRQPATDEEMAMVERYQVNIGLIGPGGSLQAAVTMMQAGAAMVMAGGAGVFIDNSALAHGGTEWLAMTEDAGPDAVSFAYVGIVRGAQDVWTMGTHVLGLPDIVMRREDPEADGETIFELIQSLCQGDKPLGHGHVVADEAGPRFRAEATPNDAFAADSPMHNPFGRLRLVSLKDIAQRN
ncbi:MAG: hypothetical protein GTO53_09695 [Planctomycetales bacterium]|nr:hypothetical protein [Planctomycetales bacterium]NIM09396.1 hypothetical protein [Planctomycetales bacterium]NIN08865.1 hypothetical protein [Planctomycetales bacterium]NIN78740.1 hypothetical protein [Planctomycetales bacterium]NIO35914.1 hypothetical protein [Planctomycetales bacterium]